MRKHWHQTASLSILALALIAVGFVILPGVPAIAAQGGYEPATTLSASQILPPDLLAGTNHRVEGKVVNDGYVNTYRIGSKFGVFTAVSTAMLRKRIGEINALVLMEKIEKTKEYGAAIKKAGLGTLTGMKNMVTNPVGTVSVAVSGLGAAFRRAGNSLSGPKRSQTEDSQVKDLIGFTKTKREYAFQFGVDVYSDNQKLQDRLNEISWAGFAGGLTWSAAMSAVPGGAGVAFTVSGTSKQLNDLLRDTPPVELRRINGEKLKAMEVHPEIADAFLNNTVFSPRQQTLLVNALDEMKGVANRAAFVRLALATSTGDMAFFRQRQAEMYAGYHRAVIPIESFIAFGEFAAARTSKGALALNIPLDHLVWTEPMAALATGINKLVDDLPGVREKQLWVTGTLSPRARKELESRGWQLQENSDGRLSQ